MPTEQELLRVRRLKERSEIKRLTYVNQIRSIHNIATCSLEDAEVVPQLLVLAESIDELVVAFNSEDDTVLDQLIELELASVYSDNLRIEMFEISAFVKATANRLREYAPDRKSQLVHSSSYTSLNKAVSAKCTQNESGANKVGAFSVPRRLDEDQPNVAGFIQSESRGMPIANSTRLPEIPLPSFDGDIYEWISFHDRFVSMVDRRDNLADIEKFYYLAGCCKGDALDVIRGIPVSDDNYRLAWATLKEKFDKPRLVASSLIDKLLNAQKASTETLFELNKFLVVFDESVSVLEALKIPNLGDFMLFSLASRCLPTHSIKLFEAQLINGFPTVKELITFVKSRVAVLECIPRETLFKYADKTKAVKTKSSHSNVSTQQKPRYYTSMITSKNPLQTQSICKCCNGTHTLSLCTKFKGWSPDIRNTWAREQRICFRCLRIGHWASNCKSSVSCGQCSRRHHSLLHDESSVGPSRDGKKASTSQPDPGATSSLVGQLISQAVILGTALVHMQDSTGVLHTVRALIDSASQISAITSDCANRLGLRLLKWTAPVSGLAGATVSDVLGLVKCQVQPRYAVEPVFKFDAWVFPSITSDMPRHSLSRTVANKYQHLALADPSFTQPGTIDVLLGADLFSQILNGKRVSVGDSYPVAFGTVFGWMVIGPIPCSDLQVSDTCLTSLTISVENLLEKFWKLEEPDVAPERFTQEGQCEVLFREGCSRDTSGRFSVPLLFRQPVTDETFRGSRSIAVKRFEQLEKRLAADNRLQSLYCDFMNEYLLLGHMSLATSMGSYFIPHHAIYRPSDIDPKIRVVFDASASSYSGTSLNQCLFTGPKLQRDVLDVLMLFRVHRYVFTTDISKMYRQVLISSAHRRYQHILWRPSPEEDLKEYELNTVTYGVNCSPYLAIRVLQKIAEQDCKDFPLVREALLYHTYVDDICVGGDSLNEIITLQMNLVSVLRHSGMELKKWSSNTKEILNQVQPEDMACGLLSLDDSVGTGTKVLGMQWSPQDDTFTYKFQSGRLVTTKRGMLSLIARMFDPLGLLSPVTFFAKKLMQQVWRSGISWDEQLPPEIMDPWQTYVDDLPILQQISIPRFIGSLRGIQCFLCGFCDASESGYAATVYIKLNEPSSKPIISLLGAKTKLAPLKASTIPRLELCAALLLARWMSRLKIMLGLKLHVIDTYAWSDSTTVLNWLRNPHEVFKIFVSNRVHKIQSLIPDCHWNYIASLQNPADCASRGLMPSLFVKHELYFNGPPVLRLSHDNWDTKAPIIPTVQLPEVKGVTITTTLAVQIEENEWFARFSSYIVLVRVTARMCRFVARCRHQPLRQSYLTREELDYAVLVIARSSQLYSFSVLRQELSHARPISVRPIARLRPFIDGNGLIRVGGRLSKSELPEDQKHQILLSKMSHFSLLLIRHWHDMTGHSGPQIISSLVNRKYWIMSIRTLIRTVISRCTKCVRLAAANPQPVMADLPTSRVTESRPFLRIGIDYAGPLSMKENRLRKSRQYKVYVAVFVCFTIRAVHLELVSDLSTDAFLAALNRFVSRRGLPTDIYSDCGTNFVGASRQLRELVNDPVCREQLTASVSCTWHFNPPGAPHFGGLWEAAVRSTKALMTRIMGEHVFTVEEFHTILCRVEAILNSRPLTPASTDPVELECLTPGHFLIGRPLLAVPEQHVPENTRSLTNRWKLVNQCVQSFWRRWRNEYLQTLQTRNRWTKDVPNIAVGDLVIIKDPTSPPLKWRMARVSEVIPGADKVVRVVRLHTATGSVTRPVVKIVRLPTNP